MCSSDLFPSHDRSYPVKGDTIIREVVPEWCWWLLGIFIAQAVYFVTRFYLKFKKTIVIWLLAPMERLKK